MKNNKKTYTKYIIMSLIVGMMLMTMTSCDWFHKTTVIDSGSAEAPEGRVSVAVATGAHSNFNKISVNSKEIADKVYESTYSSGRVILVKIDGKPEQYLLTDIPEQEIKGLSESKLKSIAEGYRNEILGTFETQGAAETPESDTLEAIRISANALREAKGSDKKYLIIVDSGLSTTGYLDFTEGLLDASTDEIITILKDEKAIPDLTGIDVVWLYCGETAEPQVPLSELQKAKLQEIYTAILEAGNANSCDFRSEAPSSEPYTDLPKVTPVAADSRSINDKIMSTVKLDPGKVQFIGDSDEFIDPALAKSEIKTAAEKLLKYPENKVYIVGGTAGSDGNNDYARNLSNDRAKAVSKVLEEYGINSDRLKPLGLGGTTPWHIDDTDANGNMIEELAQKNRTVWIVDVNDKKYGDVLAEMG